MRGARDDSAPLPPSGNYGSALGALSEQLGELQLAQIAHGRRAVILLEGPDGSGKKNVLKRLAASFDPCHYAVYCTGYDRREAAEGHWLARFWRQLPSAGNTTIFFRSWYRRVLDDLVLGRTAQDSAARVYDEINEFEAQQRDYGTLIVKLFLEVSADVQEQRRAERMANPWRRITPGDEEVRVDDPAYARAVDQLRANTDTRWSPWRMIDSNDDERGALAALEAIADAWAKAMPAEPPQLVTRPTRAA